MRQTDPGKNRVPAEKDFSSGAVKSHVFRETIQHPATIIPLGAAGGFTGLMLLGLMAMNPVTLIAPIVLSLAGGGFWVYNYSVRGGDLAARYVQNLRDQREQARRSEIYFIKEQCTSAGFEEGAKEAGELEEAYLKLRKYLESKSSTGQDVGAVRYQSLAGDIYREGLRLLSSALEAFKALQAIDIEALKRDKRNYARQLEKAKNDAERKGLESRIKNHEDRIASYEKHSEVVYQLLAHLEELEGTLENSYLELVNLSQGRELVTTTESMSRLEQAVQAARRVEERLRGQDTSAEDQIYLEASKNTSEPT